VAGVAYLLLNAKDGRSRQFNPALHISPKRLKFHVINWPVFIGVSQGDNGIVASVLAQVYNDEIRIFAAFLSEGMSLRRHLSQYIKPWLSAQAADAANLAMLGAYEDNGLRPSSWRVFTEI
jgi:hypothetical protein